jgi:NADPH:quinone reductase-like Zn-dependent oxidoreductase
MEQVMESTGSADATPDDGANSAAHGGSIADTVPDMMRALVQDAYGSYDVLRLARIERPAIADNEVLLQVHAAGVDRGTWHSLTGQPYLMRIMGYGFRRPKNRVPGLDVAGAVVAVGSAVTRFGAGDKVFGFSRGSFAEYAAAREDTLAAMPATCTYEQAAVVAVSGITALQGLQGAGHIEAGQQVLIIGASGGVGTYAVQIAKAFGAEVTGVCSTQKVDLVRSLGADHVVDYTLEDFADGTRRYDLILDIGGSAALGRLRRALTPAGTLVIVGGEGGDRLTAGFDRQLRAVALSPFVRQRLTVFISKPRSDDLERLAEFIAAGKVKPVIDQVFPLAKIVAAHERLESNQSFGKVVLEL